MGSQEAFETPALHIFYEFADVIFSVLLPAMALIINVFRCCDAPAVCDLWERHLDSVYCICTADSGTKQENYSAYNVHKRVSDSLIKKTPQNCHYISSIAASFWGEHFFFFTLMVIFVLWAYFYSNIYESMYWFKTLSWFLFRVFTQVGSKQGLTISGTQGKYIFFLDLDNLFA